MAEATDGRGAQGVEADVAGDPPDAPELTERPAIERVRVEQQQALLTLTETHRDFVEVFRRAPKETMLTRRSDLCILDVNDAWVRSSGFTREQVVGRSSLELPWWSDTRARDELMKNVRENGVIDSMELSFLDAQGETHSVLMSGRAMQLSGEECMVWQSQDITALRRAEAERRSSDERREQRRRLEVLGMLAGGIAHDFNNLLVGMMSNADLLLGRVPPDSPLRGPLEDITRSAERAAGLTRELLDYAGRGGAPLEPVELNALAHEVQAIVRSSVSPNTSLVVKPAPSDTWVHADASQLSRLLINLVKNGLDALAAKHGTVAIHVEQQTIEGRLCAVIRVRDTGIGMDAVTQERAFEPFFTTKRHGRGLGLATAMGIVQRHAGTIDLVSEEQVGSTFSITLPRQSAPTQAHPSAPNGAHTHTGRVLLVDDEPAVRAAATLLLEQLGFEVVTANSGEQALSLLDAASTPFRLAMVDASMPGLDGFETLRRMRERLPELPVLMCSGYARKDVATELEQHHQVRFLPKPFRLADLAATLKALLERT